MNKCHFNIYYSKFIVLLLICSSLSCVNRSEIPDLNQKICKQSLRLFGKHKSTISGKIISVPDGDTIWLQTQNRKYKVRLLGIDAPEINQNFGKNSKEFLKQSVINNKGIVNLYGQDQYRRSIGVLCAKNENWNLKMIASGNAWHYSKYTKAFELENLQTKARNKKLGLWSQRQSIPPWKFRKFN
jgi:endonuclease YncB( thermonuclease family)